MDVIYVWRIRFCGQTLPYFRNRQEKKDGGYKFPMVVSPAGVFLCIYFFTQWIVLGTIGVGRTDGRTDRSTERRNKQMVVITFEYCAYESYCFVFVRNHFLPLFIIKPTRCTNFPNLFRHETLHVSGSSTAHHQEFIHCTIGTGICHTGL